MRSAVQPPAALIWSQAQAGARTFSFEADPIKLLGGFMAAADVLVLLMSSAAAYWLRNGDVVISDEVVATTLLSAVLMLNGMWLAGCYTRHATDALPIQIGRAVQGCSIVLVFLLALAFFTKTSSSFSRFWAACWYIFLLSGVSWVRYAAVSKVKRWRQLGRLARTVAVVDLAGSGEAVARRLMLAKTGEMRLIGVFTPQPAAGRKNGVADLIALSRLFRIDEVIVSVSGRQQETTDAIIRKLGTIPTNVRLCPEMAEMTIVPREAGFIFGQPVLTVYSRPLIGWNRIMKRVEDVVLGSIALMLVAPIMVVAAVLIILDSPGPILFRQKRPGFNNNVITVYKFRSMVHGRPPEPGTPQAQRDDPRVTRVGKILRRTSMDELPQLFNVLKGEMSLVGPRPHAVAHNDQYAALIDDYLGRHRVQPGITGWAQVNGLRGETETLEKMKARVEHDLTYIDSWSLMLDLRILFLTVVMTFFDRNAY